MKKIKNKSTVVDDIVMPIVCGLLSVGLFLWFSHDDDKVKHTKPVSPLGYYNTANEKTGDKVIIPQNVSDEDPFKIDTDLPSEASKPLDSVSKTKSGYYYIPYTSTQRPIRHSHGNGNSIATEEKIKLWNDTWEEKLKAMREDEGQILSEMSAIESEAALLWLKALEEAPIDYPKVRIFSENASEKAINGWLKTATDNPNISVGAPFSAGARIVYPYTEKGPRPKVQKVEKVEEEK